MIYYIFEDFKDDTLSKFFQFGYDRNFWEKHFIYCEGNLNILSFALEYLNKPETTLVVSFVDISPNNHITIDTFNELVSLALGEFKGKLLVVPTFGSEYYYIKSLAKHPNMVINTEMVSDYVKLTPYKKSDYVKGFAYRKISTFEKYGKTL